MHFVENQKNKNKNKNPYGPMLEGSTRMAVQDTETQRSAWCYYFPRGQSSFAAKKRYFDQ